MRLVVSLAAIATTLAVAAPASAYVREKSQDHKFHVIWPNPRVTMTVLTGGALPVAANDFVGAATRAAATWSVAANDTSLAYTVVTSAAVPNGSAFDHENTISFRNADWDMSLGYPLDALALTTVWSQGGAIVDADTEINDTDPSYIWAILPDDPAAAGSSPDVDLQNALTHELGHVLGLDHPCYLGDAPDPPELDNLGDPVPSCSDPNLPAAVLDATMYPSSNPGLINERTLSGDELLGLHVLYPEGRAPIVEGAAMSSSGGCAVGGGPEPARRPALALVAAGGLLAAARRRRSFRGA